MTEEGGDSSLVQRQKKAKWKRSTQVCTNCRQGKNRCDFQERFPDPCSRCAALGDSRPCYVDPAFKRMNVRKRTDGETGESISQNGPPTPQQTPSPDPPGHYSQSPEQSTLSASANMSFFGPTADRAQGNVHLTGPEIDICFQEFFEHYHPFFPVMLEPIDPTAAFTLSPLLFWTICGVACRPRADNPLVRARTADLCVSIAHETRLLVAEIFLDPGRSVYNIQAVLLLCEYPLASTRFRAEDHIWIYSGFAVQLSLSLGLHRPHFANEFVLRAQFSSKDVQQRTLAWAQCFIVHQSIASGLGLPSCLSDDWVTSSASQPASAATDPLISLDADVSKLLRIQRFALRVSTVMGNNVRSKSGQDTTMGPALISILSSELIDIENGLNPMSQKVAVRFLEVKLHLYTYGLQDEMMGGSPVDLLSCYTSSIRMLELLQKLNATFETCAAFWPRSMLLSAVLAILCLLKLASLQVTQRQKFSVDRNIILREIMNAYAILRTRSMVANDEADKVCMIINFLSHRLANAPAQPSDAPKRRAMQIRSRMSLGGLLFDAIFDAMDFKLERSLRMEAERQAAFPGPAPIPGQEQAGTVPQGQMPQVPEVQQQQQQFPQHGLGVIPEGQTPVGQVALDPMAMNMDEADFDVFGWLNGMDTQAMDHIMQEVASLGPLDTMSWVGDLPDMPSA